MFYTILFLIISNCFMTYAWYGHLKDFKDSPIYIAIAVSWGVALFEYCFQVPANRIGSHYFTLPQLKIMQEVITLCVFVAFSVLYLRIPFTRNFAYAGLCIMGAVFFIFRGRA